jgi:hypothetical protein
MRLCLRHHGYSISPESAATRGTAPRNFEFVTVWNVLNPNRVALTVTISRTAAGAARTVAWTRKSNAKVGKGVVRAPVVQFGRVAVLWTADPRPVDKSDVYGCVKQSS